MLGCPESAGGQDSEWKTRLKSTLPPKNWGRGPKKWGGKDLSGKFVLNRQTQKNGGNSI